VGWPAHTYQVPLVARARRPARLVELTVRLAPVNLPPPVNDPTCRGLAPLALWAVLVREPQPPRGEEPVEWLLLTALTAAESARRVITNTAGRLRNGTAP
jgi:hypothetical protein